MGEDLPNEKARIARAASARDGTTSFRRRSGGHGQNPPIGFGTKPNSALLRYPDSTRRVLTGRNRDDERRRFCRFLAATATHRYAWHLACSRRVSISRPPARDTLPVAAALRPHRRRLDAHAPRAPHQIELEVDVFGRAVRVSHGPHA